MQPSINPELLSQLDQFVTAETSLNQLVEVALTNYLQWQRFASQFVPQADTNTAELQQKFNHLLAQVQQSEADLRQLIKEANDRMGQHAIWADKELQARTTQINNLGKGLIEANARHDSVVKEIKTIAWNQTQFTIAESEALKKFANSMLGSAPSRSVDIEVTIAGGELDKMQAAKLLKAAGTGIPTAETAIDQAVENIDNMVSEIDEAIKKSEPQTKDSIPDYLASLNRPELSKLLTLNGIRSRDESGKVWTVGDMRSMLLQLHEAGKLKTATDSKPTETKAKKRGRSKAA